MMLKLVLFWVLVGWTTHASAAMHAAIVYFQSGVSSGGGVYAVDPDGGQNWLDILGIDRIVGGVLGGYLFNLAWPLDPRSAYLGISVAATAVGAVIGAHIIHNLSIQVMMMLGKGKR